MCWTDQFNVPSFDGALEPTKFIYWLVDMDDYFKRYELEDDRRVELAKLKLASQAKVYWKIQEKYL